MRGWWWGLVATLAMVAAILAETLRRRAARQQRAMRDVLDAADALEARLREARTEIHAVAGDTHDPVAEAMREMLRQRLWLQRHGAAASLADLVRLRDSILEAGARIEQQLGRVARARSGEPDA
jgi:hypothetical protein